MKTILDEPALYTSPYMVVTDKGYTKHYYAGSERVAAGIDGGSLDAFYRLNLSLIHSYRTFRLRRNDGEESKGSVEHQLIGALSSVV